VAGALDVLQPRQGLAVPGRARVIFRASTRFIPKTSSMRAVRFWLEWWLEHRQAKERV
jgi:hypothetical protein